MNVDVDDAVCRIAAAIGEPARARMLYSLMDNHARTSTELAVVGEVSPSTASVHLHRLAAERLVTVRVQGRHRYYRLGGADVAQVLEGLGVMAGVSRNQFTPTAPNRLRAARTCYDHMAGTLGVLLHDRLQELGWLSSGPAGESYDVTPRGAQEMGELGVNVEAARMLRRRFAFGCLDWSERRLHMGGAVGAALLELALRKKWVMQELDSRALAVTSLGRREMLRRLGLRV